MATRNLKGFGWFVMGVLVAPPCYLVSSWVAAERARVESLERAIVAAKREIRDLETEFETRANHAQLEKWNGEVLALAAPRPEQFLAGEEALAQLHRVGGAVADYQVANFIVPSGLHDNRLRLDTGEVAPVAIAPVAPVPAPAVPAEPQSVAPARIAIAAASTPSPERAGPAPQDRPRRREQAVAMLDRSLLSDSTLGELASGARAEAIGRR
ncbi:hypothetical protein [Sphingomonas sp.]